VWLQQFPQWICCVAAPQLAVLRAVESDKQSNKSNQKIVLQEQPLAGAIRAGNLKQVYCRA
jgi:hypothetical protein